MKTEEAITTIGFGVFQKRLIVFGCIAFMLTAATSTSLFYSTYLPKHRCAIPTLENDTFNAVDSHHKYLINLTIPDGEEGFCNVYDVDASLYLPVLNESESYVGQIPYHTHRPRMRKCDRWVYDTSSFTRTAATEFDFVCDRRLKISHSRMLYFSGYLTGSLLFGLIGDIFGRRTAIYLALIIVLASSITLPWVPNAETYMALVFCCGFGSNGAYINIFVILMEFVEKKRRVFVVTIANMGWVAGLIYPAGFAYFVRDWRTRDIAVFYPFVLLLVSFWYVPESVRWLVRRGKYKEAERILHRGAKTNHVMTDDIQLGEEGCAKTTDERMLMIKLVTTPILLLRFVITGVNWFVITMTYIGLSFSSGSLSGDVFLEYLIYSLIEAPGYLLVLFAMDRVGRKILHITVTTMGGLACLATIIPEVFIRTGLQSLSIALVTIGKATATAAFHSMFVYTPELFPTSMRMSVVGASSAIARAGAMLAPYLADLGQLIGGDYGTIIPLLICGGATMLAGFLCILFPETKGKQLPETIEDAKHLKRGKLILSIDVNGATLDTKTVVGDSSSAECVALVNATTS